MDRLSISSDWLSATRTIWKVHVHFFSLQPCTDVAIERLIDSRIILLVRFLCRKIYYHQQESFDAIFSRSSWEEKLISVRLFHYSDNWQPIFYCLAWIKIQRWTSQLHRCELIIRRSFILHCHVLSFISPFHLPSHAVVIFFNSLRLILTSLKDISDKFLWPSSLAPWLSMKLCQRIHWLKNC